MWGLPSVSGTGTRERAECRGFWSGGGYIVTAGRMPIRPHPKHIRIQNSDGWAFLTSVSAPRFPILRVTGMGFLDRGQSKVTALSCSTAFSFRPSLRPRKTHAISLGQHLSYSCAGLTKSISGRVSLEYIFRVYTHTRGIFRSFPNTHTR